MCCGTKNLYIRLGLQKMGCPGHLLLQPPSLQLFHGLDWPPHCSDPQRICIRITGRVQYPLLSFSDGQSLLALCTPVTNISIQIPFLHQVVLSLLFLFFLLLFFLFLLFPGPLVESPFLVFQNLRNLLSRVKISLVNYHLPW